MYVGLYDVYNKSFKKNAEVCGTLTANCGCSTGCGCFMAIEKKVRLIGGLDNHERKGGGIQTGYQVYDKNGVSPTLLAHSGGYGIMILEHNRENAIYKDRDARIYNNEWRVRKLTPKECWRLMGFTDEDFKQLRKYNAEFHKGDALFARDKIIRMAGNSIPVKLLEGIFYQVRKIDELLSGE